MCIDYSHFYSIHPLQVIDGLVYISEQGLEHGSLTCSNILVSKEGTVKLGPSVTLASGVRLTSFYRTV
jgi:serine/threonine protein kinase